MFWYGPAGAIPVGLTAAGTGGCVPCPASTNTMNRKGTARAVSLSQYWNAWTNVMDRIPPAATVRHTTTTTATEPTQDGRPVVMRMVSAAPWSCGTMYSQPTITTTRLVTLRTVREASLDSVKSGMV